MIPLIAAILATAGLPPNESPIGSEPAIPAIILGETYVWHHPNMCWFDTEQRIYEFTGIVELGCPA
jgi:hypothetical protein